jgi:hypothetical protein
MPEKQSVESCHAIEVLSERIEALSKMIDERDRRYEQSFNGIREAVATALQSAKEQTMSTFSASEKAIAKAEYSQLQYNTGHNDLARKMDDQYKQMIPRPEADSRFHMLEEKIADLRESRSGLQGGWALFFALLAIAGTVTAIVLAFRK